LAVPLLVLIPALGSVPTSLLLALALAGLKATVLVGRLLTGGQRDALVADAGRAPKVKSCLRLNLPLVTLA
jgi:CPA2 family monovalent cation:H+ antiporter-2